MNDLKPQEWKKMHDAAIDYLNVMAKYQDEHFTLAQLLGASVIMISDVMDDMAQAEIKKKRKK